MLGADPAASRLARIIHYPCTPNDASRRPYLAVGDVRWCSRRNILEWSVRTFKTRETPQLTEPGCFPLERVMHDDALSVDDAFAVASGALPQVAQLASWEDQGGTASS